MRLTRIVALLTGALAVMLTVVILRSEATRTHYEICQLERRDDVLRQELHRERLALQRARDPAALLDRVEKMRLAEPDDARPGSSAGPPGP